MLSLTRKLLQSGGGQSSAFSTLHAAQARTLVIYWASKRAAKRTSRLASKLTRRLMRKQDVFPIDRLPPELLSHVFEMCMLRIYPIQRPFSAKYLRFIDTGEPSDGRLWRLHRHSDLTRARQLSQVCQFWRCVALRTPSLWVDLDLDRPSWSICVLHRSGTAPLSLSMSGFDHGGPRDQLRWYICQDAQIAQRVVSVQWKPEQWIISSMDALHETHANIEQLSLSRVDPGPMLTFTSLTRLSLESIRGRIAIYCPADLIWILRRNPRLERVSFERISFMNNIFPDEAVELRSIESFHLSDVDMAEVFVFFVRIVRPPLSFHLCKGPKYRRDVTLFLTILRFEVDCCAEHQLTVNVGFNDSNLVPTLLHAFASVPVVDMKDALSLQLASSEWEASMATHDTWRCLLQQIPNLDKVEIWHPSRCSDVDSLLEVCWPEDTGAGLANVDSFIPLKSLIFSIDKRDHMKALNEEICRSLIAQLRRYRRLAGRRLQQLTIYPKVPYYRKELTEIVDHYGRW